MAQMLGDRLLPESVNRRRRQLRNRLSNVREPLRRFREQNVPGPDVVGRAESRLMDARRRFVNRTSVVERIRGRREGEGQQDQGGDQNNTGSGQSSNSFV